MLTQLWKFWFSSATQKFTPQSSEPAYITSPNIQYTSLNTQRVICTSDKSCAEYLLLTTHQILTFIILAWTQCNIPVDFIIAYKMSLKVIYKTLQYQLSCISLIISCYILQLNCHHQGADTNIAKTYSNKIFILVINQLDAQNQFSNKFISCLYMFRAPCAHHQEVKIVLQFNNAYVYQVYRLEITVFKMLYNTHYVTF